VSKDKHINLVIANYQNGQITTRTINAAQFDDDLIRDGWVEVHRQAVPRVHVVVHAGSVETVFSDLPAMALTIDDLDLVGDVKEARAALSKTTSWMFRYDKSAAQKPN